MGTIMFIREGSYQKSYRLQLYQLEEIYVLDLVIHSGMTQYWPFAAQIVFLFIRHPSGQDWPGQKAELQELGHSHLVRFNKFNT